MQNSADQTKTKLNNYCFAQIVMGRIDHSRALLLAAPHIAQILQILGKLASSIVTMIELLLHADLVVGCSFIRRCCMRSSYRATCTWLIICRGCCFAASSLIALLTGCNLLSGRSDSIESFVKNVMWSADSCDKVYLCLEHLEGLCSLHTVNPALVEQCHERCLQTSMLAPVLG